MIRIDPETMKIAILLTKRIEGLELSTTSFNALRRWGIDTIADLYEAISRDKLKDIRGIGKKAIAEIDHAVERYFQERGIGVAK